MLIRRGLLPLAVTVLLLGACTSDDQRDRGPKLPVATPARSNTRVIGLVGSMSGDDAWRGEDAFEGADAAVRVVNRGLRSTRQMFELVTRDDHGDPATARRLIEELALGPDFSGRTVGIVYAGPPEALPETEDTLAAAGIPAVLVYGDLYTGRLLSEHVFQASPAYLWEARTIARYLVGDRGYARIGSLTSKSLSGQTARIAMTTALEEMSRRQTFSAVYTAGASTERALEALRRRSVQAIVVEGSPSSVESTLATLRKMNATYKTTAKARAAKQWRPQVISFDSGIAPSIDPDLLTAGLVASDTYARGAHYLPVPSFEEFHSTFVAWWERVEDDPEPLGWERRSFEAVRMIGWAARRVPPGKDRDIAAVMEKMRGLRLGGLDVTFGPDDHTSVDQTTVGLWVVPRPFLYVREHPALPSAMPWVPLARGFSIDGERTSILSRDWRFLFNNAPPKNGPAPRFNRQRYGVTTGRSDPVH